MFHYFVEEFFFEACMLERKVLAFSQDNLGMEMSFYDKCASNGVEKRNVFLASLL